MKSTEEVIVKIEPLVIQGYSDFERITKSKESEWVIFAFKHERIVLLLKKENQQTVLIRKYPFVAYSGKLGPKRMEGDLQIPEGFYEPLWLNPNSKYYLSIKLNYPNEFDLRAASQSGISNPGSDIFIHGPNQSKGCISISENDVEELFWLIHRVGIERVRVIIAPGIQINDSDFAAEISAPENYADVYKKLFAEVKTLWDLKILPL